MTDILPAQLETGRLVIRTAKPGDGPLFHEAIVGSLDRLSPWLSWVTPAPTIEDSEKSCRMAHERFLKNEDLMTFFFLRETGELVGGSGLHNANWRLRQFEIGYWGRTGHEGSGLITEGVKALAEHALVELKASRVFLTTDDRNTASWRLAERAGFQLEGILRNERLDLLGNLRNTRVYSRVPA